VPEIHVECLRSRQICEKGRALTFSMDMPCMYSLATPTKHDSQENLNKQYLEASRLLYADIAHHLVLP
jgi:hypothetical protein